MTTRRTFLEAAAGAIGGATLPAHIPMIAATTVSPTPSSDRFDPWLEILAENVRHNVEVTRRMAGGRPIIAVVKNNGYGLGLAQVGPLLDRHPAIAALAVVRFSEALALRDAGVGKPILVMARTTEEEAAELVRREVRLAIQGDDAPGFCRRVAERAGRRVPVHLYLDTGMGRMGHPIDRAADWAGRVASERVAIEGAFTELTEDPDFDREQVERLRALADRVKTGNLAIGPLHAASSAAVDHQPEAHLDAVRPGFMLYGGFVSQQARERGELKAGFRLKARVVRVERLAAGEGVSYHRRWKATRPAWVAALPLGHVDGLPSGATKGCEILINGKLYPVVGTVSASHTVVAVGDDPEVKVGDVAIAMGPDHPNIHPDTVARRAEYSDYGIYFHLSPTLPRVVV
jgi:alanine racemase